MNNKNFSPVIIFTYNRLDSLTQTVNYLSKNIDKEYTDIIIFSDYWKTEKDKKNVINVRNYLHTISEFKSINIIERKENYGLAKNIIEGVTEIINQYEKVIVLEDDLVTSSNFISYMNQALDFYENNNNIFAISGYTGKLPSLKNLEKDVYLSYRPSSWGWATWKDQWANIDWDVKDFSEFITDRKKIKKFNRGGIDMARMLKHCMQGKNHSWAIRWSYAMSKQDKYCVYPSVSKVQNIGFGEDATNCKGVNIYQTILDTSNKIDFQFDKDIKIDKQLTKEFKYTFSYTNKLLKRINNYISKLK